MLASTAMIVLSLALGLIVASSVLAFCSGFFAIGGAIVVVGGLSFLRARWSYPALKGADAATLFALGLGASYVSTSLLGWSNGFLLLSDSDVYDQVAREISSSVPWPAQISPFAFAYVYDAGLPWGEIAQPGFFKLLGIAYTLGEALRLDELHVQVPAVINITSFTLIGRATYKLLRLGKGEQWIRWVLWGVVITTPHLLEQLLWLRKDMFMVAVSLVSLLAIYKRRSWFVTAALIYLVGTLRLAQGALLLLIWVMYEGYVRRVSLFRWAIGSRAAVMLAGAAVIGAALYMPGIEIAPESMEALLRDRESASRGLSALLESSGIGAALFGMIYPFPSVIPRDLVSLAQTVYAYAYWAILGIVIAKSRPIAKEGHLVPVLWIATVMMLVGFAAQAIVTWKTLGFVIAESRFKIFPHILLVILFCVALGSSAKTGAASRA